MYLLLDIIVFSVKAPGDPSYDNVRALSWTEAADLKTLHKVAFSFHIGTFYMKSAR